MDKTINNSYSKIVGYFRTTDKSFQYILNNDGNQMRKLGLIGEKDWTINHKIKINNETFYRIGTFEWVKANGGFIFEPKFGNLTVSKDTTVFNSTGKIVSSLKINSSVKYDRYVLIDGRLSYRINNNRFILVPPISNQ